MNRRPNILFIILDDLAYGDLSLHGNPHCRTPELDALAGSGTRLERYGSGPICTPARAALMTGRHPYRTGVTDAYLGRSMIHPSERTLAQVLAGAGYRCGLFGKWHLGDCFPMRPQDLGFHKAIMHRGGGLRQPGCFGNGSYFDPVLEEDGRTRLFHGYCTDIFFEEGMRFIDQAAGEGAPFFAYVATNAPHSPFEVPEKCIQRRRDTDLPEAWARLYGMVENIDCNVGRIRAFLEERGLADNTLVVFTSDHGPCPSANGPDGSVRYNAGLCERKATLYEGGIRVPSIWSLPGTVPEGRSVDRLANAIDILPTLAAFAGADLPQDRVLDGRSLHGLITGAEDPANWPDREVVMQWQRRNTPVHRECFCVMTQRYKLIRPEGAGQPELYDLEVDPGESRDLAGANPERVARFLATYDRWWESVTNERPDNFAPPPIVLGDARSPEVVLTPQDWRLPDSVKDVPGIWGVHQPGTWVVEVREGRPFTIRVELPVECRGAPLRLRCGGWTAEVPTDTGPGNTVFLPSVTVELSGVRLPAGRHEFTATWQGPDGRPMGVLQVMLVAAQGDP